MSGLQFNAEAGGNTQTEPSSGKSEQVVSPTTKRKNCEVERRNKVTLDSKVCLTSDIWTSSANDPYLSVTCHFIKNEWNPNNFLLDVFHFFHPHDGCFIYDAIKELCEDFSILNNFLSVTSDNAGNAVLSGEMMNADIIHVRCTIELSHEKKIVSSSLYPCLKTIESHLNGILKNCEYEFLKKALDGMMEKFKKDHKKIIDLTLIYHVLDPRFKLFCIQHKDEKRNAKNLIENLFELYSINAKVDSQSKVSSNKSRKKESIVSLTQQYLAKVTKTKATNEDEIDSIFKNHKLNIFQIMMF
ncbi:unnamed protein product [Brachionus calyciflorus]|uniref:hAT-like transposase RNase-H fold domain-containing protein n=1 Tax=Brachionus calyciflorus TaxID=104777 RepID=A0A814AE20_9BILA|nr:unnamed protein product [Brachionus calyciflorus]